MLTKMIAALLLAAAGADLPGTSEMNVLFRGGPTGGTVPVNCWSFLPLRSIFSIRPVLIRVIPLMTPVTFVRHKSIRESD